MAGFKVENGVIAPMLAENIDTDVIMPKQFLKGIDRKGLDQGIFFDQRFLAGGVPNPEFVLNRTEWTAAKFLAVGPNFGCGSSREHAVWGLKQLGVRALIGTSFAGIFFDNSQRNGLLLIELPVADFERVAAVANEGEQEIAIDLPKQTIRLAAGEEVSFEIETLRKQALLQGGDAIAHTLRLTPHIRTFEARHFRENPWLS
ncbi:3-isopropylmalate dehydratase small subunit [Kordiimonas sp.]|uniref:3-isopropylmalate dehydratase small subunit n=1 Tax=Kordiimonas sp. TaxID=1970157 RepID=UPI003A8D56A3